MLNDNKNYSTVGLWPCKNKPEILRTARLTQEDIKKLEVGGRLLFWSVAPKSDKHPSGTIKVISKEEADKFDEALKPNSGSSQQTSPLVDDAII